MEIKIGLCAPNPGWEIILSQQGLNYEKLSPNSEVNLDDFCLIIPNPEFIQNRKSLFENYVQDGGYVILDKETFPVLSNYTYRKRKVKYIIPGQNSIFHSLGLIDFCTEFYIPAGKSFIELDCDCNIYKTKIGKGSVVILSFSVNESILSETSMRKRFYAKRKELSSEVVSCVNKGKIRELILRVIGQCLQKLRIPLIEKSVFPDKIKNTFIFRVDTDFCSAEDAQKLYDLCRKYNVKATWFIDTHDEKILSDVYPTFKDHELALHCAEHKVYTSYEENYDHFKNALDVLNSHNIDAEGFAAPFGEWNEELGRVIEDLGLHYSSEFALDYDDLPFYPFMKDRFSSVLQIPIHPISIGRLRRSHFSKEEMVEYYKNIIDYNFSHNIPAIIYHHPHHKKLDVLKEIFLYVESLCVWNPTMYEFSSWWKKRMASEFSYIYEHDSIKISSKDPDMYYKLINKNGNMAFVQSNKKYKIGSLHFTKAETVRFDEKKSMRTFYWRDVLQNYEQRKAKKRQ